MSLTEKVTPLGTVGSRPGMNVPAVAVPVPRSARRRATTPEKRPRHTSYEAPTISETSTAPKTAAEREDDTFTLNEAQLRARALQFSTLFNVFQLIIYIPSLRYSFDVYIKSVSRIRYGNRYNCSNSSNGSVWGNVSAAGYNQTSFDVDTATVADSNTNAWVKHLIVDNHGPTFVWMLWTLIGLRIAISCVAIIIEFPAIKEIICGRGCSVICEREDSQPSTKNKDYNKFMEYFERWYEHTRGSAVAAAKVQECAEKKQTYGCTGRREKINLFLEFFFEHGKFFLLDFGAAALCSIGDFKRQEKVRCIGTAYRYC